MPSILIIDDHPVFCAAMSMVVEAAQAGAHVTSVSDLAAAQACVRERSFDLVLLDLALPDVQGMSGLLLMRQLLPNTALAVVSARQEPRLMRRVAECGARGFIPKSIQVETIVGAVKALLIGGQWFPEGTFLSQINTQEEQLAARFAELSAAQMRVLRAVADGRLNKQIAHDLGVAETTVKSHLQAIFRKLGVANRMQAVGALAGFEALDDE